MNVDLVKERVEEAISLLGIRLEMWKNQHFFFYHLSFFFITSSSICYSMLPIISFPSSSSIFFKLSKLSLAFIRSCKIKLSIVVKPQPY